jgi:MFS family permease
VLLRYQSLWRKWTLATICARLPGTMAPVGLLLVGYGTDGSIGTGAQLAGTATLVSGVVGPLQGRWLDRSDLRFGLQLACALGSVSLVTLALAYRLHAHPALMLPIAAMFGVCIGPIAGGLRALLPLTVTRGSLNRASAVEPVISETAYIIGPALAGIASAVGGPLAVLGAMALCSAVAAVTAGRLPTHAPGHRAPHVEWKWKTARMLYLIVFATCLSLGIVIAAVPGRVAAIGGSADIGGGLLSLMSVGSAIAGWSVAAPSGNRGRTIARSALLLIVLGALLAPLAALPSVLSIALLLPLAGAPMAPLYATGTSVLQSDVPRSHLAEAFTRYAATVTLGTGAGQALVGVTIGQIGPESLLALSAVPCLLAGVLLLTIGGRQ